MAKVILGSYMVRYPMGGNLSWALQWAVGIHRLGHEVYMVEKAHYPQACFDPVGITMTDDPGRGIRVVHELLGRYDLGSRWCFVDFEGRHFGLNEGGLKSLFSTADLFMDLGSHGSWNDEASQVPRRILLDGEPAYKQIHWEKLLAAGGDVPAYDSYYTNGLLVGQPVCTAPLAGKKWKPLFNPVVPDLLSTSPPPGGAPYTTVMNWRSHDHLEYQGVVYGQKDVEFEKFMDLPSQVGAPLELAVAGPAPRARLLDSGWRICDGHQRARSVDDYWQYINGSRGEFGVCKNIFVAHRTGWFSDRSAAYLASGRPVVLQDSGFSAVLPTGDGLFAVSSVEEAAAAIDEIEGNYTHHSTAARELAEAYLSADRVIGAMLDEVFQCGAAPSPNPL